MDKEFCLSDKIKEAIFEDGFRVADIPEKDVKEFIKRLKEMVMDNNDDGKEFCEEIDKLAGDELTK